MREKGTFHIRFLKRWGNFFLKNLSLCAPYCCFLSISCGVHPECVFFLLKDSHFDWPITHCFWETLGTPKSFICCIFYWSECQIDINAKNKANIKQISQSMKLSFVNLHISNHYIYILDSMLSNFTFANINCLIMEFILLNNTMTRNTQ